MRFFLICQLCFKIGKVVFFYLLKMCHGGFIANSTIFFQDILDGMKFIRELKNNITLSN